MNKIIVASYMGSGSSAVTDLLSEYEGVYCPNGSYEYIFLHCPGGLFDLEDKLLIGNNALRSDEALRTFENTMKMLYENGRWWFAGYHDKLSSHFLNDALALIGSLCTSTYKGLWYEQEKLSKQAWMANRIRRKMGARHFDLVGAQLRMAYPTPDEFYAAARQFIEAALSDLTQQADGRALLLDQLLLPHNLWRAENYFPNDSARIIVVSRDPRDVFALNKYVWLNQDDPVPVPTDAEEFCNYFLHMREAERPSTATAMMRVQFEDLVLKYDETCSAIESFLSPEWCGRHANKRASFNPDASRKNIGVYAFSEQSRAEASIIEKRLGKYLYPIEEMGVVQQCISETF